MKRNVKLQTSQLGHLLGLSLWSLRRNKLFQTDGEQFLSPFIDYRGTSENEVLNVI